MGGKIKKSITLTKALRWRRKTNLIYSGVSFRGDLASRGDLPSCLKVPIDLVL